MATLLVKNARLMATMDNARREIENGGLYCKDGFIQQVGSTEELPQAADEILDLSGHLLLPGLVNTHHHFYQTLTRAVPAAQDANLFNWLKTLYPIWARMTPDDIYVSTKTALAEMALSGCTTSSDHLYLFPNGSRLDDEIIAAREMGMRLHASRGSMSLGESNGGLPPDSVVDSEEVILKDSQRLIEQYHDPNIGAMTRVVLAPCSPFSVTGELMKQSAQMARQYGAFTHTAETRMKKFSASSSLATVRWDTWNPGLGGAGCVVCPLGVGQPEEIDLYARTAAAWRIVLHPICAGIRHRACLGIHGGWRQTGVGCGWLRVE